ncbi:hypothetical protein D3C80_1005530 [compost metagenome]
MSKLGWFLLIISIDILGASKSPANNVVYNLSFKNVSKYGCITLFGDLSPFIVVPLKELQLHAGIKFLEKKENSG